jgi:hypothetical protein
MDGKQATTDMRVRRSEPNEQGEWELRSNNAERERWE